MVCPQVACLYLAGSVSRAPFASDKTVQIPGFGLFAASSVVHAAPPPLGARQVTNQSCFLYRSEKSPVQHDQDDYEGKGSPGTAEIETYLEPGRLVAALRTDTTVCPQGFIAARTGPGRNGRHVIRVLSLANGSALRAEQA